MNTIPFKIPITPVFLHILEFQELEFQKPENLMIHSVFTFRRPWFKRSAANPQKTSLSTAYMDAAGVGKIISISQAIFEGMTARTTEECQNMTKPWPGGCRCQSNDDCEIGLCCYSEFPHSFFSNLSYLSLQKCMIK